MVTGTASATAAGCPAGPPPPFRSPAPFSAAEAILCWWLRAESLTGHYPWPQETYTLPPWGVGLCRMNGQWGNTKAQPTCLHPGQLCRVSPTQDPWRTGYGLWATTLCTSFSFCSSCLPDSPTGLSRSQEHAQQNFWLQHSISECAGNSEWLHQLPLSKRWVRGAIAGKGTLRGFWNTNNVLFQAWVGAAYVFSLLIIH